MMVTIRYVNFPKIGGKYGSLKLADGTIVMCPPDLLGAFRSGMTCDIATKQQTWGQGTAEERVVTIATSGPLPQGGQQGAQQGAQQPYGNPYPQTYAGRNGVQRPNAGFQPRVIQGGPPPSAGVGRSADQDRLIFVTGVVGRAMGSGKFSASEIPVLAQAAAAAFEALRDQPKPPPAAPDDPGPQEAI